MNDPKGSIGKMTGNQLQAARVLIGWSQANVAEAANVSVPTVKRAEGAGKISASLSAVDAIQAALEAQGIQFLDEGDTANGAGVVLVRKGET